MSDTFKLAAASQGRCVSCRHFMGGTVVQETPGVVEHSGICTGSRMGQRVKAGDKYPCFAAWEYSMTQHDQGRSC